MLNFFSRPDHQLHLFPSPPDLICLVCFLNGMVNGFDGSIMGSINVSAATFLVGREDKHVADVPRFLPGVRLSSPSTCLVFLRPS